MVLGAELPRSSFLGGDPLRALVLILHAFRVRAVHVEPVVGVLAGGTRLRVIGLGFEPSMTLMVRVGDRALDLAGYRFERSAEFLEGKQDLHGGPPRSVAPRADR